MKAAVWTKQYGTPDVLQLKEIEKPTPKDNEVLIRVAASTVTAGDCEGRGLKLPIWLWLPIRIFMGFRKPTRIRVLGQELAGEVEAVGQDVQRFKPGDSIFASAGLNFGGYGEYACLPENGRYLMANPRLSNMVYGRWLTRNSGKTVISQTANQTREDLIFLKELIEAGTLKTVIDRRYPLAQTAAAHRYVETGQKKGNVIIVHHA